MAILLLNHKIFLRFSKLSLTKAIFYTFMQTPSGKTSGFSGREADFDAVIRENKRISGREADFDAVIRENRRISGRENDFYAVIRKNRRISGRQADFDAAVMALSRHSERSANGPVDLCSKRSPWAELRSLLRTAGWRFCQRWCHAVTCFGYRT